MATMVEYALMAGASYISTRVEINQFPVPADWSENIEDRRVLPSGFEATYFTKGTEVVISFAGTYPTDIFGDQAANFGLATGLGSVQLLQAADYYLRVRALYPNATITLTGHSLGGGLAALVGVFFDKSATTFDQAPFAQSALAGVAQQLMQDLLSEGYSAAQLSGFDHFLTLQQQNGGIPNSDLVTNIRVDGEFAQGIPVGAFNTIGNPPTVLTHGPYFSPSVDMHAQSLLTAFLQSEQSVAGGINPQQTFSEVTKKLTDLLKMIFDDALFDRPTDKADRNLLDHLVRHEAGVQGSFAADAMVTRFTADMWKLAKDGGLTMSDGNANPNLHELSNALIAFAMQKYYDETSASAGYQLELFNDLAWMGAGSGGIYFDRTDVAAQLKDAKGYQYLQNYLKQSQFTFAEGQLILSRLPAQRDWYVQAGASAMIATDSGNHGAFMLGGGGTDSLTGGSAADLLVGNAGADTLTGGLGNDMLLGGTGNDTYQYTVGDGFDVILDSDGAGSIVMDGSALVGGAEYGDNRVHRDGSGHLYVNVGLGLVVDGNILVRGHQTAQLGLNMTGAVAPTNPVTTRDIPGDISPTDISPMAGIQAERDAEGNLLGTAQPYEDILVGDSRDERIVSGDLADDIGARDGDDWIESGSGSDYVNGDAGNDLIEGGANSDILMGGTGNDRLFSDSRISVADAISQGNGSGSGVKGDWLSGNQDDDTLVGGSGNDVLVGGTGADLLIAGAGDDNILGDTGFSPAYIAETTPRFSVSGINWYHTSTEVFDWSVTNVGGARVFSGVQSEGLPVDGGADVIYAGAGNDYAWGGIGNDVIFGEKGSDRLSGNSGHDVIVGGDNDDFLYGDGASIAGETGIIEGNDYLDGGEGADELYGQGGDDILVGGKGVDRLYGGAGKDTYIFNAGDGKENINDIPENSNNAEASIIVLVGVDRSDIKYGRGSLAINLGNGDEIHIEGFDYINPYASSFILAEIQLDDGSSISYADVLAQGFDIDGTEGDDNDLSGTGVTDRIRGFGGNDGLGGLGGDDLLDGGGGDDTLFGGDGHDVLLGAEDVDTLWGEAGNDTLEGGTGADILRGEAGADTLTGGDGDDALEGGAGDDTLNGGAGADQLLGGEGSDNYLFSAGHGADTLIEYGDAAGSLDTVAFTQEIDPDSIRVRRDRNDLTLTAAGDADIVRVADYFSSVVTGVGIERVVFANGTVWDAAALSERATTGTNTDDTLVGTESADVLRGFAGNDSLDGVGGDDRLEGGVGLDTYVLGWSGGTDTVIDDAAESSIVQLDEGMLFSDLGMARSGDDLHLSVLDTTSELVLPGYYAQSGNWTVRSATGVQQTLADVLVDIQARAAVASVAQAEQSFIDSARRRFLANLASFGASGDISVSNQTSDAATIYRVSSTIAGSTSYYILPIERVTGGPSDNFFDLRSSGVMTVDGGAGNDFIDAGFSGAEGIGSFLYGNAGDDTIVGSDFGDVLHGGAGVNYLAGNWGDDTYLLLASDSGTQIIDESVPKLILQGGRPSFGGALNSNDTLTFGAGIAAGDLVLSWSTLDMDGIAPGNDHDLVYAMLDIAYGNGATARVVLPSAEERNRSDRWWGIEAATFADGTTMSFAQLLALAPPEPAIEQNLDNILQGTVGADVFYGYAGNDVLLGLDGADTLYGGDGFDVIDGGAGNDLLSDSSVPEGGAYSGNNLFLGGAGDDVIRPNETNAGTTHPANLIIGGAGQDAIEIEWLYSNNWIVAFNRGEGIDTIANPYGQFYGNGTLSLGGGITAGEVSAQVIGNDLFIGTGGGEGIALQRWAVPYDHNWENLKLQIIGTGSINTYDLTAFALGGGGLGNYLLSTSSTTAMGGAIAYRYAATGTTDSLGGDSIALVLSDSSFGTAAQSIFPTLIGTEANDYLTGTDAPDTMYGRGGNDVLLGGAGDDTLDGGAGNDFLDGGEGNDTYLFGSGYGQDNIGEFNSELGGLDRIRLTDLTPAQITVTRTMQESGGPGLTLFDESFYLLVNGTQDWVRFHVGASAVERIEFADATTWDEAALRARVQMPTATAAADLIGGTSGDDSIAALDGNDQVYGNEGHDLLSGEGGDDTIEGGRGNDLLFGGEGNDDLLDFLGSNHL